MLRLTTQKLAFFLKNNQKLPFLSSRITSNLQRNFLFATAKEKAEFNQMLASGKYYEVLGFTQGTDINGLSDTQVKRQYLAMVKKYHSDGVVDPVEKIENQEITKCIISAFDKVSSQRIRNLIDKGIYNKIYKDEDQIAMKIYGKKFNQIKYELFKEGNSLKRTEFMELLEKTKKQSKYYDASSQSSIFNEMQPRQRPIKVKISSDFGSGMLKIIIPVITLLAALNYYYQKINEEKEKAARLERNKSKLTLSQEKIKQIEKKSTQLYEKKLTDLIDSYVEQQPPALKYPSKDDPDQLQQLIEYTIATDISLYEISSHIMGEKQNLDKLKTVKREEQLKQKFGDEYDPFQLSKIKVNTYISLSLEAERCLQNIYIKVKDVADEIEKTGKYTPPKIFFKFYGYLMFDIREKPLCLQNYRETEYVSLFDLFFNYYSPIPLKRHEYNEYLVGLHDEDMKMYGQVHLNHRRIPERYITKDDKVVVMREEPAPEQIKYKQIWHKFYRKYMRIWKRGYADRISTEHQ